MLSVKLFCADCGAKLYQDPTRGWTHEQEHFVCATYCKIKGGCLSHQIHHVQVEEILLRDLHRITACAREYENDFVRLVTRQSKKELNRQLQDSNHELAQVRARISKLNVIMQRLYKDNVKGKISDERFSRMSMSYEIEQKQLESRKTKLIAFISASKEQRLIVDSFLDMVWKYTNITELSTEIIQSFTAKIEVMEPEKVSDTQTKKQTIIIHWNFIGAVEIPDRKEKWHNQRVASYAVILLRSFKD